MQNSLPAGGQVPSTDRMGDHGRIGPLDPLLFVTLRGWNRCLALNQQCQSRLDQKLKKNIRLLLDILNVTLLTDTANRHY